MNPSDWLRTLFATATLAVVACSQQDSQPSQQNEDQEVEASLFTRFVPVGDEEGRFETAIVTYQRPSGEKVALIAAVHIADAKHYAELQREFEQYDALLYELVANPNDRPKPGQERGSGGIISMIQGALKRGLELEFQLDAVDYTKDNFVHADLTPETFREKMEERGESFASMFLTMMMKEMRRAKNQAVADAERRDAAENGDEDAAPSKAQMFDLVSALRRREGRQAMFSGGGSAGTTLLEGRNERALEVLREELAKGHDELAIYYGAAHMPGIEHEMLVDMGFEKIDHKWLTAWDLTKRLDPKRERSSEKR